MFISGFHISWKDNNWKKISLGWKYLVCKVNSGGKQTHLEGGCDKHPIWLMETEGEINTEKDRMHLTAIICKMAAAVQAFGWWDSEKSRQKHMV